MGLAEVDRLMIKEVKRQVVKAEWNGMEAEVPGCQLEVVVICCHSRHHLTNTPPTIHHNPLTTDHKYHDCWFRHNPEITDSQVPEEKNILPSLFSSLGPPTKKKHGYPTTTTSNG